LRPPRRRGPLPRLLLQLRNALIYVLLAAGLITALLARWVDTAVILGVVAINAVIGFIQEGKRSGPWRRYAACYTRPWRKL
jgi:magnesium-transporting ATPase (P-type)